MTCRGTSIFCQTVIFLQAIILPICFLLELNFNRYKPHHEKLLYFLNLRFQASSHLRICGCRAWFVSDLVGNPKDRFSYLLAHLSRRLMGELIGYPCSGVRPSSSTISNIFSETTCPIKAKFYVEPPWVGGTKVCLWHLGHMTKMAATPIYGKNPSKIFSRTGRPISTKLGM